MFVDYGVVTRIHILNVANEFSKVDHSVILTKLIPCVIFLSQSFLPGWRFDKSTLELKVISIIKRPS